MEAKGESRDKLHKTKKKLEKCERKLEKANKYNQELETELNDLKAQLHEAMRHMNKKYVKMEDSHTQTEEDEVKEPDGSTFQPLTAEIDGEGNAQSIADILRSTAEQAVTQTDYVYDENTGLYYDHKTGYYYNPENGLFFDSSTYTYYTYDKQSGAYLYHSQADTSQYEKYEQYQKHQQLKQEKLQRRAAKLERRQKREERKRSSVSTQQEAEHAGHKKTRTGRAESCDGCETTWDDSQSGGEIESGGVDERGSSGGGGEKMERSGDDRTGSPVTDTEEGEVRSSEEEEESPLSDLSDQEPEVIWRPPCIRLIVISSDSLSVGELHIITVTGATVGRESSCAICIPEALVSKDHCSVIYKEQERSYYVTDTGSINGVFINSNRLSQCGETASVRLSHRDSLRVGSTDMLLHIHPGTDTCSDCEPGIISSRLHTQSNSASIKTRSDVERERRAQLKSIRQKYGLEREKYVQNSVSLGSEYEDKAEKRRQKHGLDLPNPPDEGASASVDTAISEQNVGHKLLAKMGWREGESLGKTQEGILEPVKVDIRLNNSAGLGAQSNRAVSMDQGGSLNKSRKKAEINLKTRTRYEKAKTCGLFSDMNEASEEDVN